MATFPLVPNSGVSESGGQLDLEDDLQRRLEPVPEGKTEKGVDNQTLGHTQVDHSDVVEVSQPGPGGDTSPIPGLFPVGAPEPQDISARVDATLAMARANAARDVPGAAPQELLDPVAKALLGLNSGVDEIVEAVTHIKQNEAYLRRREHVVVDAFDRLGYHVLRCAVAPDDARYEDGKTLNIAYLKASHGRNVRDLKWSSMRRHVPGRGNRPAVAALFDNLIQLAVANGYSQLSITPGFSTKVAQLYSKIGFAPIKGTKPKKRIPMVLDLTNRASVEKALTVFLVSRAGDADVPKNIQDGIGLFHKSASPALRPELDDYFGDEAVKHTQSSDGG